MRSERDSDDKGVASNATDKDLEANPATVSALHGNKPVKGDLEGTELTVFADDSDRESDRDSIMAMAKLTRQPPKRLDLEDGSGDNKEGDENTGDRLTRESLAMLSELGLRETQYKNSLKAGKYGNLASLLIRYRKGKLDPGSRKEEIKRKFEYMKLQEDWKQDLVEFWVAFDPCFITDIDIDAAWTAILRREAWRRKPFVMTVIHFTQLALALFSSLSQNSPVNTSTAVMAILYIFILLVQKDFTITNEFINDVLIKDWYEKKIKPKFSVPVGYFICFLASPVLLLILFITFLLEFFIGKMMEVSIGSLTDLVINVFVICTSISVGLRSGNGISAIQTFVGFEFISGFDEIIIEKMEPNFYARAPNYMDDTDPEQKANRRKRIQRKNNVRILIYIIVPCIFAFYVYLTAANPCFVFCDGDGSDDGQSA